MSNPVVASLQLAHTLIRLPDDLANWWKQIPTLDSEMGGLVSYPQEKLAENREVDPTVYPFGDTKPQLFFRYCEWGWDRATLPAVAKLATPAIVIGSLIVVTALAAGITTLTGVTIPGLEVLVKYLPLSLAFSLVMIRTGTHLIYQGVILSRRKNRFRQDAIEANEVFRISNNIQKLSEEELKNKLSTIYWLNAKMPPEKQIQHNLGPNDLYGKQHADFSTGRVEALKLRHALQKLQPGLLPALPEPYTEPAKKIDIRAPQHKALWDRWYDWWHKRLPALGLFDMVMGQLMLVTAGIALFCVFFPGSAPSSLDLISKDPYLSISVSFLMLSSWINCTRTGWRMLTYSKREAKRACNVLELQLIDLGIEKRKAKALCLAIIKHMRAKGASEEEITKVKEAYTTFRNSLVPLTKKLEGVVARWRKETIKPPATIYDMAHKLGKKVIPYLATPQIALGVIITLIGLLCLGFSIAGVLPSYFEFLAKNNSISFLFSCGVVISGFHTIQRGATMGERPMKEEWKKEGANLRKSLIHALFSDSYPQILPPKKMGKVESPRTIDTVALGEPLPQRGNHRKAVQNMAKMEVSPWYNFWIESLKTMAIPDVILGLFLLTCGCMGLAIAAGATPPEHFEFIWEDPSFSASFCVSLILLSADALVSAWRMAMYKQRKQDDREGVDMLHTCFEKLFPNRQIIQKV